MIRLPTAGLVMIVRKVQLVSLETNRPIDLTEATLSEDTTSACVSELKWTDRLFQKDGSLAASRTTEIAGSLSGSHGIKDGLET
jgi:hypothetical protein